jgi:hypothetical protein
LFEKHKLNDLFDWDIQDLSTGAADFSFTCKPTALLREFLASFQASRMDYLAPNEQTAKLMIEAEAREREILSRFSLLNQTHQEDKSFHGRKTKARKKQRGPSVKQ